MVYSDQVDFVYFCYLLASYAIFASSVHRLPSYGDVTLYPNPGPRALAPLHAAAIALPSRISSLATESVDRSTLCPSRASCHLTQVRGASVPVLTVEGALGHFKVCSLALDLALANCTLRNSRLVRDQLQHHGLFPFFFIE